MAEQGKKASWRGCPLYRNPEKQRRLASDKEECRESFLGRGHRNKDPKLRANPLREGKELRAEARR